MRSAAVWCVVLALSSVVLLADDHTVLFDEDVDFSNFKTFIVRDGHISSDRPELNFPAVMKTLTGTIRQALVASGLRETAANADLVIEYRVTGVDFNIGPAGRANAMRPGQRGRGGRGGPAAQVDFTEATLVIDMTRGDAGALLWRGVYRDNERDAGKLAEALPKDAAKLLTQYPPRRKS
jgi:hypothetical protein